MYVPFLKIKREEIRRKIRKAFQPTYKTWTNKNPVITNLHEFDELWNELTDIQIALFEIYGVDKYY